MTLGLTASQRCAILSVIDLLRGSPTGTAQFEVQVGGSRQEAESIESRLRELEGEEIEFTLKELHMIYASLMVAPNQFVSEEAFYIRLGLFRENVTRLAGEIVRAIGESSP